MMLTDSDIVKYTNAGFISIEPFNKNQLGSNSYDLRLGNKLLIYTDPVIDSKKDNPTKLIDIPEAGFQMMPGELYLGYTVEKTTCNKVAPQVEGKSSVGRLGIQVHLTAGFGDIGFSGHWTLEMTCVKSVFIYAGMPIAQIYFFLPLGTCNQPYGKKSSAKYQDQEPRPIASQMWKNFS